MFYLFRLIFRFYLLKKTLAPILTQCSATFFHSQHTQQLPKISRHTSTTNFKNTLHHLLVVKTPIRTSQKHHTRSVEVKLRQCFSTGVARNLRVPRVAVRGHAETDRICLGRNSQPQFYAVVAMPLFHTFVAVGSLQKVSTSNATFAEGSAAAKRLKNTELRYELANSNTYLFRWSYSSAHRLRRTVLIKRPLCIKERD